MSLTYTPRQTVVNGSGRPYAGARAWFYRAGTTTAQSVFSDSARVTPHTNPVVANAAGRFPQIYLSPAYDYRCIVKDSGGNTLFDDDYIPSTIAVRRETVGTALYPLTDAESAAEVVPTDYAYPPYDARRYGAAGDGTTDDTAAIANLFAAAASGSVIDLAGLSYKIYTGNSGVASGDAASLTAIPRLASKSKITIRNGRIFAASPGVASSVLRYPSTLAIDGCTDITLINVTLQSKGESYGDSDSSSGLDVEDRRNFLAQNGGHALVVTRSSGIRAIGCNFELCGSVASFYSSSSDDVVLTDCYSSPQSLGYSAYAADSWCGAIATSGFTKHEMVLNNCRTSNNGATYGSKGGVTAEDVDVTVRVLGGHYADSYANGSAHYIGAAFAAVNAAVYVSGAQVNNCAAIGLTYHSAAGTSTLECTGIHAKNLRTSMHINGPNSFGTSVVKYQGCHANFGATSSLWGSDELSQLTVVANRKIASDINVDLIDCHVLGPKYLSWNKRACYGGIRIVGGYYEIEEQIFKSLGWGGSGAGSGRGFQVLGGTRFRISSTSATSAISDITNLDGESVATYLHVDFDDSVIIDSAKFRSAEVATDTTGSSLTDRKRLNATYIGCGSVNTRSERATVMKIVSLDGVFGSNYRITVTYPTGVPALGITFDDTVDARNVVSYQTAPAVVGTTIQAQVNVEGTGNPWTVASTYPIAGR
jgi:hypothetical protein